ncbi:MAG: hypothetical protein KAT35_02955, partial [Candidatus Aenigmarchaeota archaeon]|nr:hypothetical protein [Candidatus Aenigmarchaeota archaeon]
MFFHLRAGKYQPWLKYLSVFVDISLITIVMWAFGTFRTFKTEAFLLYYVWIALATMRLSVKLTIFSGILSLVCYTTMVVTALVMGTIETGTITESFISPKVSMQNQVLRIMYMSIVIYALTYGARAYRKLASSSYEHEMEAERNRMRAQKLESVGFLAGGIAHDFNNILAVVSNNLHVAKLHAGTDSKALKNIEAAETAAQKATSLTRQLLTFSKGGDPILKTLPMYKVISESVGLSMTGASVKCVVGSMPGDLRLVKMDEGQINQVLSNLLINALQSSSEGDTISLDAANHDVTEGDSVPLPPGQY